MGFSYTYLGLCCDFCNNSGAKQNVKKIRCPYGFCQSWACCNICFKAKKHLISSCDELHRDHKDICKKRANMTHEELLK